MKERPILFSAPMVRAILDGRKTQTRRIVKNVLGNNRLQLKGCQRHVLDSADLCPFGKLGDQLWVRETWQAWHKTSHEYDEWEPISVVAASASKRHDFEFGPTCDSIEYRATSESVGPWTPSIHMPRWASRIQLEITGVRVERLQDISEDDARAEGADYQSTSQFDDKEKSLLDIPLMDDAAPYRNGYAMLWESINGSGSWDANPWVWVLEFRRIKP